MIDEIKSKLSRLRSIDEKYVIFGSFDHKYKLGTPLTLEYVLEICNANNIELPHDYVEFITQIGNGGAGTGYGMSPLNDALKHGRFSKPFAGVSKLLNEAGDEYWRKDRKTLLSTHSESLTPLFETEVNKIETIKLFRKAEELNLNLEDGQFYWIYSEIESLNEYPFNYENIYIEVDRDLINGYIELFSHGCGHVAALVVKGESKGLMIEIGNDGQLGKTNQSFSEYYLNWLNKSIEEAEKHYANISEKTTTTIKENGNASNFKSWVKNIWS